MNFCITYREQKGRGKNNITYFQNLGLLCKKKKKKRISNSFALFIVYLLCISYYIFVIRYVFLLYYCLALTTQLRVHVSMCVVVEHI